MKIRFQEIFYIKEELSNDCGILREQCLNVYLYFAHETRPVLDGVCK